MLAKVLFCSITGLLPLIDNSPFFLLESVFLLHKELSNVYQCCSLVKNKTYDIFVEYLLTHYLVSVVLTSLVFWFRSPEKKGSLTCGIYGNKCIIRGDSSRFKLLPSQT